MLPGAYPPDRCINSAGNSALCETGRVAAASEVLLDAAMGLAWFCQAALTFGDGALGLGLVAAGALNVEFPIGAAGAAEGLLPEATKELNPVEGYLFPAACGAGLVDGLAAIG
jgi:hypothetical protein